MTEAAFTEVHTWRALLRDRAHLQDAIGYQEAEARLVQTYQPLIVPGLLQTADYAAAVFAMSPLGYSPQDTAAAVAGRINRQAVLHRGGRFEFLIGEAALRWRPGPNYLLIAQLERVVVLSTAKSISIGLVVSDDEAVTSLSHGFVIYEGESRADGYVAIETLHADITVAEPADVELYRQRWTQLGRMAVYDNELRNRLSATAAHLRRL
jgi:hypothetical protein